LEWSISRKRIIRRAAIVGLILLSSGLLASWIVAGKLIAPEPRIIGEPPSDLLTSSISFGSQSGSTIAGWHVEAENSRGVIVLIHGLRGSRLAMLERAKLFHGAGYSIVMIDLQAHGESPGDHITLGHLEQHDVWAAVAFAREHHPEEPIGVLGISLGGASALLASPLEIDALVLESVYSTIDDAVHNRVKAQLGLLSTIPAELLLSQLKPRLGISRSGLRPIDHLSDVGCPVFVISGTDDQHTTADETQRMFSVARDPKELWLVDGAAHEDLLLTTPAEYKLRVVDFFNRHMEQSH